MPEYRYVYSIMTRDAPLLEGLKGIGGGPVEAIWCGALAAAVSAVAQPEIPPSADNVLRHEAVVEALHHGGPSVPVRFGTVLPDADAVRRSVTLRREQLMEDLARVGDKQELGVTALWAERDEGDAGPEGAEELQGLASGTRYMLARFREHRREAELRERAAGIRRDMDRALLPHALDVRSLVLPSPGIAVRATYLIEPGRIGRFERAFEELRLGCPELRMLLTGPWPPYSFVTPFRGPAREAARPAVCGSG